MKKAKTVIVFVLGMVMGALCAVGIYFLTVGDVSWREYVENDLVPNAVLAISTAGTICVAALPIISKVQNAVSGFNKVSADVGETVEKDKNLTAAVELHSDEIKSAVEEMRALRTSMDESINKFNSDMQITVRSLTEGVNSSMTAFKGDITGSIENVQKTAGNIDRVVRIGFGGTDELVRKGFVREIQKVGQNEEES